MPCGFQPVGRSGCQRHRGGHIRPFTCLLGSISERTLFRAKTDLGVMARKMPTTEAGLGGFDNTTTVH